VIGDFPISANSHLEGAISDNFFESLKDFDKVRKLLDGFLLIGNGSSGQTWHPFSNFLQDNE
jgi:hypothetical protein